MNESASSESMKSTESPVLEGLEFSCDVDWDKHEELTGDPDSACRDQSDVSTKQELEANFPHTFKAFQSVEKWLASQ